MMGAMRHAWLLLALVVVACAAPEVIERLSRGPRAEEILLARSLEVNNRPPSFDEKRYWEDRLDARISRYLREHPELQQTTRYSDFRFWKQVMPGSTREEVRVLLEEPDEKTIDPALMAALAAQHWPRIQRRATEAWVYPLGWVLYFDEKGVVEVVRRGPAGALDD
jgi:hypothetical protein